MFSFFNSVPSVTTSELEEKINKNVEKAIKEITSLKSWVSVAKESVESPLQQFKESIKDTLGARSSEKFTREAALFIDD